MKIQNPHDKFFKEMFGRTDVAKDFLNNYLPTEIKDIVDINTLEPQKDSFVKVIQARMQHFNCLNIL